MILVHHLRRPAPLLALLLLLGAGCGSDEASAPPPPPKPAREAFVAVLEDLLQALEAKDYDAARGCMAPFPGVRDQDMKEDLADLLERREISPEGLAILAKDGTFGPLLELFPKRGRRFANAAGVDATLCWAMSHDGAEVAAHWTGDAFRIIRLDDVGKLH